MPPERIRAFGPGRVNLIGEHTDYNGGLALPFAISAGVVVDAVANPDGRVRASAVDFDESDDFSVHDRARVDGWRAFVRGMVAELTDAGIDVPGAWLRIGGDLPRGAGLSSSAALEVALCLALLALARDGAAARGAPPPAQPSAVELARLCARVENDWVGAQTGLLDQLASLCGQADAALLIDFATLRIEHVPLRLDGWRLVVLDSRERHAHAGGDYNQRRAECARACELLGVQRLSEAEGVAVEQLPQPLRGRGRHVLSENGRVLQAVAALRSGDLRALGALLNASHASLRDDYEVSTPAVEATVARLLAAGAAGARIVGGGFGGCVLGLFAPGREPPADALAVQPGAGARLLAD